MVTARRHKLSVLVPVFNERFTIAAIIERVLAAHLPAGLEREVIIVDDGSTDGTSEQLKEIAACHGEVVKILTHPINLGKGAAIRTAISSVEGSICLVQDADLEYDPRDHAAMVEPILTGEADAVFGTRFAGHGRRRVLYFWHSIGNRWLTTLSNLVTNLNLTDMETCYKAVRTEILKSIPLRCDRFGMEPELTSKLSKRGCRIYEVPISYHGRRYIEGKKITWRDGLKALFVIAYFGIVDDIYHGKHGHAILHRLSKTQRFNSWMADTISPWIGSSVLEIGAGIGNLTRSILPREYYTVTDVDPLHLDFLENHFDQTQVSVAHLDLERGNDFASLDRRYDTVICLNVLEHVENDAGALKNMRSVLCPGGRAIILVPRASWLYGTLDRVLGHFRRYSPEELKRKCEVAGFEVEEVFTFNKISVLPWYVNGKILKRTRFDRFQLGIFDSLVWLWKRIDRLLPWRGLSVIAVVRQPDAEGAPEESRAASVSVRDDSGSVSGSPVGVQRREVVDSTEAIE